MLIRQEVQWSKGPQAFHTEGLRCKEDFEQPIQLESVSLPLQGIGIKLSLRSFLTPNHPVILWKRKTEEATEEAGLVPYMTVWVFLYYTWNSGAGSHSIAELLSLPGDTSFLGNTLITCPSKMPLGMVWDQADWNVGESLSPPARKEPEGLLTDNEVEVAWERPGEFQGKNVDMGFMGVLICPGSDSGYRWGCTACTALDHLQKGATTSRHQQVQAALLSGHVMNDTVWEMLFWPVQ